MAADGLEKRHKRHEFDYEYGCPANDTDYLAAAGKNQEHGTAGA
jgi:hypothetical protein